LTSLIRKSFRHNKNLENEPETNTSPCAYLIEAPIIIGKAQSWNALRRPTPSAIQPLNIDPTNAPPRHVLTTRPSNEKNPLDFYFFPLREDETK
jgi:hypothetical protein